MTQERKVIEFIRQNGSITTMQAFGMGVTRLASRVHDLRCCGVPIEKEMVTVLNRDGDPCRVARYTISGDLPERFSA